MILTLKVAMLILGESTMLLGAKKGAGFSIRDTNYKIWWSMHLDGGGEG